MPLRLLCWNPFRQRVAQYLAVPAQALEKAGWPEDFAGAGQGLGDLQHCGLGRRQASEPAYLDRVREGAIAVLEDAGGALHEWSDLFKQRPRRFKERRGAAYGMGGHLHKGIVPRHAGLVSRCVVEPPRLEDFRLVQRPQFAAAAGEADGVEQSIDRTTVSLSMIAACRGRCSQNRTPGTAVAMVP